MNLCIDIGNTTVKLAVFDAGRQVLFQRSERLEIPRLEELSYNHPVDQVILSSVVPVDADATEYLRRRFPGYRRFTVDMPLPLTLDYGSPETLGLDRLAAAAGAWQLFPGRPVLVVDAGTCMTADLVDATGCFRGGNISPGIGMRLRAMHRFTAGLPLVDAPEAPMSDASHAFLGHHTQHAVWNGAVLGTVWELEGMWRRCASAFDGLAAVLTGGDGAFLADKISFSATLQPMLVLQGLNTILRYNVEKA
ncbi:MAG: hypothetical protein RLY31_718 [Bacteroidota bacterium]